MTEANNKASEPKGMRVGAYEMFDIIAKGGFATIHLGRKVGARDDAQLVAIKRPHSVFLKDPEITRLFLEEARILAAIEHPNVVPILEFIEERGEVFVVMDYVEGLSLGHLIEELGRKKQRIPLDIVLRVMSGTLHGLHAAHVAKDQTGNPIQVVHRDVSPDNILVGVDGHARIIDFGVARALGRYRASHGGHVDGKLNYMAPEQVLGKEASHHTDVFSAAVVLWQCLTGEQLFLGDNLAELAPKITAQPLDAPSTLVPGIPARVDEVVLRGLERDPARRWPTAKQMAEAIEQASTNASPGRVAKWVQKVAAERLARRADTRSAVEVTPSRQAREAAAQEDMTVTKGSTGENSYAAVVTQVVTMPAKGRKKKGAPASRPEGPSQQPAARVAVADGADRPPPSRRGLEDSAVAQPMAAAAVGSSPSHPGLPPASQPGLAAQPSQPGVVPVAPAVAVAAHPSQPGLAPLSPPAAPQPAAPAPVVPVTAPAPTAPEPSDDGMDVEVEVEPEPMAPPEPSDEAAVAAPSPSAPRRPIEALLDESTPAPQSDSMVDVASVPGGAQRSRKFAYVVGAIAVIGAVVIGVTVMGSGPGASAEAEEPDQAAAAGEQPEPPATAATDNAPPEADDSATAEPDEAEPGADEPEDDEPAASAVAKVAPRPRPRPPARTATPPTKPAAPARPAPPPPRPPKPPPRPPAKPAEEDLFGRE